MSKTLGEVLEDLSYGPFSNLAIGGDGFGDIPLDQQRKLLRHINEGLIRLYSRFLLAERQISIRALSTRTLYPLRKVHADSDISIEYKFIADSPEMPFEEDVIQILRVENDKGQEYPLNNYDEATSLFTPKPDVLQIPEPDEETLYHVLYQARHKRLVEGDPDQDIDLPEPLHGALEAYVAYRVYANMNGQEHKLRSDEHLATYEAICGEVLGMDLAKTSLASTTTKLEDRGFV